MKRKLTIAGAVVGIVFVLFLLLPFVCVGGMYSNFWFLWGQPLFFLVQDDFGTGHWLFNALVCLANTILWASPVAGVWYGIRAIRRRRLHTSTIVLIHVVALVVLVLNELPETGTYGHWPPGFHVERPTTCAQRTGIYRGWPYSFYSSYVWTPGAPVSYQYWKLSMAYNLLVALLFIVPAAIVWELGVRYLRRRERHLQ